MATDQKISQLTAYTTPQATDIIPIVDTATGITKSITYPLLVPLTATSTTVLTNKTLTSPVINTPTITNKSSTGTDSGAETLTNKTMTDSTNNLLASSLKTATTSVSISGATAPSNGQVLMASNSTTASWQTPTATPDYSCRLHLSTTQNLIQTTPTVITFDAEDFDTDTMHDNVTNNSRITFTHAGKYVVSANIVANSAAGTQILLQIRLNGTTVIAQVIGTQGSLGGSFGGGSVSTIYSFSAADYIEILSSTSAASGVAAVNSNFEAFKFA